MSRQAISAQGTLLNGCLKMTRSDNLGIEETTRRPRRRGALLCEQLAWQSPLLRRLLFQAAGKQPPVMDVRRLHAPINALNARLARVVSCVGLTFARLVLPLVGRASAKGIHSPLTYSSNQVKKELSNALAFLFFLAPLVGGAFTAPTPRLSKMTLTRAPLRAATHLSYLTDKC